MLGFDFAGESLWSANTQQSGVQTLSKNPDNYVPEEAHVNEADSNRGFQALVRSISPSVQEPREIELVRKGYQADTLQDLRVILESLGELHPDAYSLLDHAQLFCTLYNNPDKLKPFYNSKHMPDLSSAEMSLNYLAGRASEFCGLASSREDFLSAPTFNKWLQLAYSNTSDPTLKKFIEIVRSQQNAGLGERVFKREDMETLESILYATDSHLSLKSQEPG